MTEVLFDETTVSAEETEALGRRFAERICGELADDGFVFVALNGGLGAGKTAFVRGMESLFAPDIYVHSPSYTIVNEYRGNLPDGRKTVTAHFDVWRIKGEDDLYSVGFFDWFPPENGMTPDLPRGAVLMAVEWCDSISYALPENWYQVDIDGSGDSERHIIVTYNGQ